MKKEIRTPLLLTLLLALLCIPSLVQADPGNQYCVTPPFITAGLKPNLMLMIDNSASMYDLEYQDTGNLYCANAPTTACTAGSTCAGAATCSASVTVSGGTTSYTAKACTADSQCPNSPTTTATVAKACTAAADCNSGLPGDGCQNGACKKTNVTVTTYPCNAGFCRTCNTTTGVGDCATTTTAATYTPIACTTDATCSAITAGDTCNNKCTVTRQCYDTSYNTATTYSGYFDSAATYYYNFTDANFTSGATMPASCTYAAGTTKYLCVNTTGSGSTERVVVGATGFVASGNFLNWLATSKFDIEKQILTGGKFDAATNELLGESRGCAGRKFIKAVPGVNLTFAIRGGTPGGIGTTQSQATEYGQTYIEISTGVYNAGDCLSAMNNWMTLTTNPVNLGAFQNDTKGCVGAGNSAYNAVNMWNHILHDCYNGILGRAQGYSTNLGPLEGECKSAYATIAPSDITDPNSGISICSSALSYVDAGGTAQTGYLGACYNSVTGVFDNTCALTQMANFCTLNVNTTQVADPSSTDLAGTGASAPGFILEQGLMNTNLVGTFPVAVYKPTAPTGLIDKYSDRIRFGVMTFQNDGSGTECGTAGAFACAKACYSASTGYTSRVCLVAGDCPTGSGQTCQALPKADGGKLVTYVGAGYCSLTTTTACNVDSDCASLTPSGQYCVPTTGNHSSGLVKGIDDIPATSWTPFAEAFYSAIGYFARANAYSATPPTSRSDANFSFLAAPNTAASYVSTRNPSQYRCQSNNIMLITDGMSTADRNSDSEALATLYAGQVPYITKAGTSYKPGDAGYDATKNHGYGTCPPYAGSRSVSDLAWVAKNRDIKTLTTSGTASTTAPNSASETITTYVVYSGPQTSSQPDLCDPKTLMNNTAVNGGTSMYSATNPTLLYSQLDAAMSNVAAKAASGTAASILSNSEGSGANILQAVFYPKKIFDASTSVSWIGEMQNLWYFVDPYIQNSTIREDTDGDLKLNLVNDYVARFSFNNSQDKTMVQLYSDANGDGVVTDPADNVGVPIDPDYVKSIWRAGMKLWDRNLSTDPRTIYTGYNSVADSTPQKFSNLPVDGYLNTWPGVWGHLQLPAGTNAEREALATKLIDYTRGTDQADDTAPCLNASCTYRPRMVTMGVCSGNHQKRCTTGTVATDCPSGNSCLSISHEWKLGDIISSTPRVQSTVRLNSYNLPAPGGYNDKSYDSYVNSNDYKGRGMVYVGANDGMLHAFKLGTLNVQATGFQKAALTGTNLGAEQWAFIPKNVFPYLKYFSDKDYSHLYSVDGRTNIFDASIGDIGTGTCIRATYWLCDKPTGGSASAMVDSSNNLDASKNVWRSIVLGGMGLGGASRNNLVTETCTEGASGSCVKTPLNHLGFSSYFALDVTVPTSPKFLWEFSDNNLGFSTTAPAIIRVGDKSKNGRWFAVFGNGPFGPIDPGTHQFKAQSSQPLRFFVVDLRTGALLATLNNTNALGISDAFVGTMLGGSIDADRRDPTNAGNYTDDAIYAGYVSKAADSTWTDGGVVRIMTKDDPNPANWVVSKVISGIGPVTSAIARSQDTRNKNLWLYFGTGRYYYRDAATLDDNDNRRALFGLQEPCYNTATRPGNLLDSTCTTTLTVSDLVDQTSSVAAINTNKGWKIDLDAKTATEGAERVVTDSVALTNGTVFFTSFKPTMDICGYGGNSFLWGVKYDTGGQAAGSSLLGKALIQLSTGEFKEVDLSSAFTDKLNRRMATPMTGKPPSDAPPIISSSQNKPIKKILHIQER